MKDLLYVVLLFILTSCATPIRVANVTTEPIARADRSSGLEFVCFVVSDGLWDVKLQTDRDSNCWCFSEPVTTIGGYLNVISVLSDDIMCTEFGVNSGFIRVKKVEQTHKL